MARDTRAQHTNGTRNHDEGRDGADDLHRRKPGATRDEATTQDGAGEAQEQDPRRYLLENPSQLRKMQPGHEAAAPGMIAELTQAHEEGWYAERLSTLAPPAPRLLARLQDAMAKTQALYAAERAVEQAEDARRLAWDLVLREDVAELRKVWHVVVEKHPELADQCPSTVAFLGVHEEQSRRGQSARKRREGGARGARAKRKPTPEERAPTPGGNTRRDGDDPKDPRDG